MKTFLKSLAGLVTISILGAILALFLLWSSVPDMIANNLSKKIKVSVNIGDIELSLGSLGIEKFEIGNLHNAILPRALSIKTIDIIAPLSQYFKKHVLIDEITLDNIYLGLEFDSASSTKGNWTTLLNNYNSSAASSEHRHKTRTLLIKRLVLNNISTDVVYRKEGGKVHQLPPIQQIVLTNVTDDGGLLMDQLTNSVLGGMLQSVFQQQNLKNMLENLITDPPSDLKKLIEPFQNLFK